MDETSELKKRLFFLRIVESKIITKCVHVFERTVSGTIRDNGEYNYICILCGFEK